MKVITCGVCGHIGINDDFIIYGGIDNVGYGTCRTCYTEIPFTPIEQSLFPFWYYEFIDCYGGEVGSDIYNQSIGGMKNDCKGFGC